jgi:hypothetical protein
MLLIRSLLKRDRYVICVKYPIDDGIDPDTEKEDKLISVTAVPVQITPAQLQ